MAKAKSGTIKLETGSVYKKDNTYYYRYQVNGARKSVSLQTSNEKEAVKRAQEYSPITKAKSIDVISAHVKHARDLEKRSDYLYLTEAWEVYAAHPDRAMPSGQAEQIAYQRSMDEFVALTLKKAKYQNLRLSDITPQMANAYAQYLRSTPIGVSTHNRKIRHLTKIFSVLSDYYPDKNPFKSKSITRSSREEQQYVVRRQAFTIEEEERILTVLGNSSFKVKNKEEIRIIYVIGMNTGQRLKDCVLLQWHNVDMNKKMITLKQFKTGKDVSIPISNALEKALIEAKNWQVNQYVCPKTAERYNRIDSRGKNIGNNLVNKDVMRPITWIGLQTSVKVEGRKKSMTLYGFHSLRHSFVSFCADANIPKSVVVSIIGANSDIIDKYYTHVGEEAQRKAIDTLFAPQEDSIKNQVKALLEREPELSREELIKELKRIHNITES